MPHDLLNRRLENLFPMLLTSKEPLDFTETPEALSNDYLRQNSLSKKKRMCLLEVIEWIGI